MEFVIYTYFLSYQVFYQICICQNAILRASTLRLPVIDIFDHTLHCWSLRMQKHSWDLGRDYTKTDLIFLLPSALQSVVCLPDSLQVKQSKRVLLIIFEFIRLTCIFPHICKNSLSPSLGESIHHYFDYYTLYLTKIEINIDLTFY